MEISDPEFQFEELCKIVYKIAFGCSRTYLIKPYYFLLLFRTISEINKLYAYALSKNNTYLMKEIKKFIPYAVEELYHMAISTRMKYLLHTQRDFFCEMGVCVKDCVLFSDAMKMISDLEADEEEALELQLPLDDYQSVQRCLEALES